jgi:hypothetical protein
MCGDDAVPAHQPATCAQACRPDAAYVTGIAIGVAVFVAMCLADQSVLDSFQNTIQKFAGATDLQGFCRRARIRRGVPGECPGAPETVE